MKDIRYTEKGSEWNYWDLHIHSPDTKLNNNYNEKDDEERWNKFFVACEGVAELKVIGITDYCCMDGYLKAREHQSNHARLAGKLLLPNIEIRLSEKTDKGNDINFHFIFSPEIVPKLSERFFTRLSIDRNGKPYCMTSDSLIELGKETNPAVKSDEAALREGIIQFRPSIETVKQLFGKDQELRRACFVVVSANSTDGTGGQKDDGLKAIRKDIIHFSDALFSGNPTDRDYFLGQKKGGDSKAEIIKKFGALKPVVHGCDAHGYDKIGKPDKSRYCWIKGELCFDGLRQTIYEPEHRVFIGEYKPPTPFYKIEKLTLNFPETAKIESGEIDGVAESLCWARPHELLFSDEFTCIIGGRGTGKSLLLNLLGQAVGRDTAFFRENTIVDKAGNRLSIEEHLTLEKTEADNLDFLSQNEIEIYARDKEKLAAVINKRIIDSSIREIESRLDEGIKEIIDITDKMFGAVPAN